MPQVETIGDAYMLVSGHDGVADHASRVLAMARYGLLNLYQMLLLLLVLLLLLLLLPLVWMQACFWCRACCCRPCYGMESCVKAIIWLTTVDPVMYVTWLMNMHPY
jgi:hypothetical protein